MKKSICVVLVLCLACTLFAGVTVRLGGAYNFITGSTGNIEYTEYENGEKTYYSDLGIKELYKSKGFGFDISADFNVAKNLAVWGDFNMVFGSDAKYKFENMIDWLSFDTRYEHFKIVYHDSAAFKMINTISISAGVAYKLKLDIVDVKLGGGVFLDRIFAKVGIEGDVVDYELMKVNNLGLALYADASYKLNRSLGIGFTIMPHIGFYNSYLFEQRYNTDIFKKIWENKAKCFKLSFAMPIVLGVSYSF